jgi:hypothetical protein
MKDNQKSKHGSNKPISSANLSSQNNEDNSKKSSSSQKAPEKTDDKEMKEGEEFIKEGHGHNYSVPFAGEDGGTEDQSAAKGKKDKLEKDKKEPAEQGKTAGENSTI